MPEVLLVDDEAMIRTLVRNAIKVAVPGAAVIEADCGDKALRLAASHVRFELVVTDIVMPGMDGLDLAGKLAADGHASRFVFMSGYADPERLQTRLAAFPCFAFLPKPFDIPRLIQTIRSMTGDGSGRPEPVRKAAVRRPHQRAEFRVDWNRVSPLDRDFRRVAGLNARTNEICAGLNSAFASQAGWIRRIAANIGAIRAVQRRLPARSVTISA